MRNFASTLVKFSKLSHIQTTIWRPPKMAPPPPHCGVSGGGGGGGGEEAEINDVFTKYGKLNFRAAAGRSSLNTKSRLTGDAFDIRSNTIVSRFVVVWMP